jgi:hypothetical protein
MADVLGHLNRGGIVDDAIVELSVFPTDPTAYQRPRLHLPSLASTPPCQLRATLMIHWQRAAPPTAPYIG